jgi:hypothetical protein
MTPEIKIYAPNLTRDLEAYVKTSSRTAAEVVNGRAFFSMVNASRVTSRADRQDILELGLTQTGSREYMDKRSGKKRTRYKYELSGDNAAVENYVRAMAAKTGKEISEIYKEAGSDGALQKLAMRWITRKLQSIGFLASTFKPLIDKFRRHGNASIPSDLRRYKSIASTSKPAKPDEANPEVVLKAIVNDYGDGVGDKPRKMAEKAMSIGINMEIGNMRKRLEEKMGADFERLNNS